MSLITRYSGNQKGAIVITGNTLGLSRLRFTQNPGTDHAINQFITTNTALPVPPAWASIVNLSQNANVTFNWAQNSSAANLNMLAGYTVLYAELVWGGMSISNSTSGPSVDVSSSINNAIQFTTPAGANSVTPDPATAQTAVVQGSGTFYIRSQNVTNLVVAAGNGSYTVGGVPSAININESNTLNHAGWTLIVAYGNAALPPRNMTIYVGEELVGSGNTTNVNIAGFLTPPSGAISARFSVSAQEGDAVLDGDQMLFGQDAGSLNALSGPNNPSDNFFASQINIGDPNNANVGKIDVTGTFGTRNANALTATNIVAGRQGWDVTNVDGSAFLDNNQTSALVRLTSSGDVYVLNTLGIQIDTILVSATKSVDKTVANLGDTITYTVNLLNEGGTAQTVTFTDPIPSGTTLVPNSLTVSSPSTGNLTSGIQIPNVQPNQTVQIQWKVLVGNTIPNPNPIQNTGVVSITGLPDANTNTVSTTIRTADKSIVKTAVTNPIVPGQLGQYSITASNAGPYPAQNVFVNDVVPANIMNPQFSTDGGTTWNPWPGSLGLGTLNVNQTVTFLLRGTVTSTTTTSITNTATITSTTPDSNPANDTSTITTPVSPSADLAVAKTGPATIIAGNQIQYSVVVNNNGPSASQGVQLADVIPASVTNAQYSTDNGLTWNTWTSPLAIGQLLSGESRTILFRGTVASGTTQNVVNTATVSGTTPDPNQANNTSTVTTTVTTSADVGVVKTQDNNTPGIGDTLTYTIAIRNYGPSDSQGVVLTDAIPAGLTNPEYSLNPAGPWTAWTGTYNVGTLTNGQEVTVYIRGEVNTTNVITNTATVAATTPDPNTANNSSTISTNQQNATLGVLKVGAPKPVTAGNTLTYTISISNDTAVDAYDVTITDPLPTEIVGEEYSLDGGTTWIPFSGVLNVGTVAANTTAFTVLIRGTVASSTTTTLVNTVSVSSTNAATVTATDSTTVTASADIYVTKVGVPQPITAGQLIQYTMLVGNNGPSDAQNVEFTDTIPSEILNPTVSVNFGPFTAVTSPYTVALNTVVAGQSPVNIRIRGTLDPSTTADVTNVASIDTTTSDPVIANNTATFTSDVNTNADLKIEKTVNADPVTAGDQILYTITVTNEGISDAQNVVITDTVDPRITAVRYSTSQTGPFTDWTGSASIGTLAANDTATIYIIGVVESDATGTITNTATVTSTTPDSNPDDNTVTITTTITQITDVEVVKTALNGPITAGNEVLFRVIVSNNGPSDAANVSLQDVLPANVTNVEYSTDGGTTYTAWTSPLAIGTLTAFDEVEVLIKGILDEATTADLVNTAVVSTTTPDSNPNNNTSTATVDVETSADLSVNKVGIENPPRVGDYITHSIAVSNHGPSSAVQTILTDSIPAGMNNPEYSLDGGLTWTPWTGSISIPVAPAGFTTTVLIRGIVDPSVAGTQLSNVATVSSNTPDPDPSDNTSSFVTTPTAITTADVGITKTSTTSQAQVGSQVTYTLTVTNQGAEAASDVVVTDTAPSNLSNLQYSIDSGTTWLPWTGTYSLGTLAAGGSAGILLRGTVVASQNPYILNVATVSTSSADANPANNTAVLVTPITTVTPPVPPVPGVVNLQLQQFVNRRVACVNEPIRFLLTLRNLSATDAENVLLMVQNSNALCGLQYSLNGGSTWMNWTGTLALGTIPAGAVQQILLSGVVTNTCQSYLVNSVRVYVDGATSNALQSVVTVPIG